MPSTNFSARKIAQELQSTLSQAVIDAMLAGGEDVSSTQAYIARRAQVLDAWLGSAGGALTGQHAFQGKPGLHERCDVCGYTVTATRTEPKFIHPEGANHAER